MLASSLLLFLFYPSLAGGDVVHDPSLAYVFNIYGQAHIENAFKSLNFLRYSMQHAHELDAMTPRHEPGLKHQRVACFTYSDGERFADRARVLFKEGSPIAPVLVDNEGDLVCFTVKFSSSKIKQGHIDRLVKDSGPIFDHIVPTALKIDGTIYNAVQSLVNQQPHDLNATYLTIATRNISIGGSIHGVSNELKELMSSLSRYPLNPMQDFFWTSMRTVALFSVGHNSTSEEAEDSQKMKLWYRLSEALEYKLKEYRSLGLKDPCSFSSLKTEYHQVFRLDCIPELAHVDFIAQDYRRYQTASRKTVK